MVVEHKGVHNVCSQSINKLTKEAFNITLFKFLHYRATGQLELWGVKVYWSATVTSGQLDCVEAMMHGC